MNGAIPDLTGKVAVVTGATGGMGQVIATGLARAKLMTVTAGYALAADLATDNVTLNALHPGIVATDIIDDLVPTLLRPLGGVIRRSLLTLAQGAETALCLATDPHLAGVTGKYFNRDTATSTPPVSHDPAIQQRLITLSRRHFTL